MSKTVLGIDVSKDVLDMMLLQNNKRHYAQFANDPSGLTKFSNWLKRYNPEDLHACLEATGQYSLPATKLLYQKGYAVSLVNPARIKSYRDSGLYRNKTDRLDAFVIADFCRTQEPEEWTPPSPAAEELKALVRHLDDLQGELRQERNRFGSGISSSYVLANLKEHIQYLDDKIMDVKKRIQKHIDHSPELKVQKKLLVSIPGIAELTAAKLLAEIQDIHNFKNAAQLAAYAGVTPRQYRSGTSVHKKTRMAKTGNAQLRKAVYMPAVVAKNHNPIVKEFCNRLEAKGKLKMVVVGAAMRKLLHIVYGVLKNGKPFDPNYLKKVQETS